MHTIRRGGPYFRLAKPRWLDPLDPSFSKVHGGRWNEPGSFGVLYLNATLEVAAANARWQHRGRAIGLFDLRTAQRPLLIPVDVPNRLVLDVVTTSGLKALRLPERYPYGIGYEICRPIGRRTYRAGVVGIACRSAAECTLTEWIGEELAWFDNAPAVVQSAPAREFAEWYPDVTP